MYRKTTKEEKHDIIQRYFNGEPIAVIARETPIPRSTLYLWIRENASFTYKKARLKDFTRLQQMYEQLQRVTQILQTTPYTASAPLCERLDAITLMSKEYNVNNLCFALKVANRMYCNHIKHRLCTAESGIKADCRKKLS